MVHFSYRRYLENSLRAVYDFKGSPLRMRFKGRGER
jgi:GTP-binding protein